MVHVYDQLGTFSVSVEVSSGEDSAPPNRDVRVWSPVGRWDGVVTGHTAVPSTHPVPMTSFVLTVFTVSNSSAGVALVRSSPSFVLTVFTVSNSSAGVALVRSTASIDGSWADDAGCQVGRGGPEVPGALTQILDVSTRPGFDPAVVDVVLEIQPSSAMGRVGLSPLNSMALLTAISTTSLEPAPQAVRPVAFGSGVAGSASLHRPCLRACLRRYRPRWEAKPVSPGLSADQDRAGDEQS